MDEKGFTLTLNLQQGYQFLVDFHLEGLSSLRMDEPPPNHWAVILPLVVRGGALLLRLNRKGL